jgi:hypothetical protein
MLSMAVVGAIVLVVLGFFTLRARPFPPRDGGDDVSGGA